MVAQTVAPPDESVADADRHDPADPFNEDVFHHRANRGGLRRLISSIARLLDIQYRIWLTEAKIAVAKMVMYVLLFGAAALLGVLGIIFLFIGAFHVLTDVFGLAPVWAYLIFAGVQFALAVILVLVAKGVLNKPITPPVQDPKGEE